MEWRDVARLVVGYLPEIDQLAERASGLGLLRRVAVAVEDNDAPHSPLYWDLMEAFARSLSADAVAFELDTETVPLMFLSLSLMREYIDNHPEVGRPFNRATFYVAGRAVAFIDVEPWGVVGGPFPYHDSWTFSIYRDTDDMTRLRGACCEVFSKHGLQIDEDIHGLPAPRDAPRWKRFVRWLFR